MAEGELQLILDTLNPFHIYSTMFRVLDQRRIQGGGAKGALQFPQTRICLVTVTAPQEFEKKDGKRRKRGKKIKNMQKISIKEKYL